MSVASALAFGTLLRQLRKRAGMTQRDLAAALDYSDSLISSLEKGQRQPDVETVSQRFVPALGLRDEPVPGLPSARIRRGCAGRITSAPSQPPVPPCVCKRAPVPTPSDTRIAHPTHRAR